MTISVSCNRTDFSGKKDTRQERLTDYPYRYIDTESRFTDSTGLDIIIQNSLPKGVGRIDPPGKGFDRIFWTRLINESATPIKLTINFPADSLAVGSSPDSYLTVFLPADTMTLDKEALYAYGVTSGLIKSTPLQRSIPPKEESLFYIGVKGGVARGELILRGHDLFYNIKYISRDLDSTLIPCGQIVLKN